MSRIFEIIALFCILSVDIFGDESPAATTEQSKISQRWIPADVLRDFPGVCFASTRCATVDPGVTWDLAPFCGRSTCVRAPAEQEGQFHLLELVEDCASPKPNPKCKVSEKTNKTAPFPECCPIFECEPGVKLEYPEPPTAAPATETQETTTKPPNA